MATSSSFVNTKKQQIVINSHCTSQVHPDPGFPPLPHCILQHPSQARLPSSRRVCSAAHKGSVHKQQQKKVNTKKPKQHRDGSTPTQLSWKSCYRQKPTSIIAMMPSRTENRFLKSPFCSKAQLLHVPFFSPKRHLVASPQPIAELSSIAPLSHEVEVQAEGMDGGFPRASAGSSQLSKVSQMLQSLLHT